MENSWQLKHPHFSVAKVPRKSNSLSMVVVGSKTICLLKYSLAAIILQRSGDVAVLLNPGPINAGNLSTRTILICSICLIQHVTPAKRLYYGKQIPYSALTVIRISTPRASPLIKQPVASS